MSDKVRLVWELSKAPINSYNEPLKSRIIATINPYDKSYILKESNMPGRLVEDTRRVMELLEYYEDDNDVD